MTYFTLVSTQNKQKAVRWQMSLYLWIVWNVAVQIGPNTMRLIQYTNWQIAFCQFNLIIIYNWGRVANGTRKSERRMYFEFQTKEICAFFSTGEISALFCVSFGVYWLREKKITTFGCCVITEVEMGGFFHKHIYSAYLTDK